MLDREYIMKVGELIDMPNTNSPVAPSESHCSLATVLQQLQDFVALESRVATSQEMGCRESRDYRAADRHRSFSLAMHKVRQRVRRIARDHMIRLDQ